MGWQFVFDGETYRDDDITLDQAERLEAATGSTWFTLAPLASAKHARVIIGLLVSDHTGKPVEDIEGQLKSMTVNAIFDLFSPAEDDLPSEFTEGIPQEGGEP